MILKIKTPSKDAKKKLSGAECRTRKTEGRGA
jgi:hypothetical protein